MTNREIGDGIAQWLKHNPDATPEQRRHAEGARRALTPPERGPI